MDYCEEVLEKYEKDLFPRGLGIRILELKPGNCRVEMTVREEMTNFHGITHGGAIFALADTAFGLASNSRGPAVALQVSINFLAPSRQGEVLQAEAREECLTNSTGIYSVSVKKEKGEPVSLFRGTVYRIKGRG